MSWQLASLFLHGEEQAERQRVDACGESFSLRLCWELLEGWRVGSAGIKGVTATLLMT